MQSSPDDGPQVFEHQAIIEMQPSTSKTSFRSITAKRSFRLRSSNEPQVQTIPKKKPKPNTTKQSTFISPPNATRIQTNVDDFDQIINLTDETTIQGMQQPIYHAEAVFNRHDNFLNPHTFTPLHEDNACDETENNNKDSQDNVDLNKDINTDYSDLFIQQNLESLPYSDYKKHLKAHITFDIKFKKNPFGYACHVCDRLWFEKDLRRGADAHENLLKDVTVNK